LPIFYGQISAFLPILLLVSYTIGFIILLTVFNVTMTTALVHKYFVFNRDTGTFYT